MGRLAPASAPGRTNILRGRNCLLPEIRPQEYHPILSVRMTLSAACASLREGSYAYFPAKQPECGCPRCTSTSG